MYETRMTNGNCSLVFVIRVVFLRHFEFRHFLPPFLLLYSCPRRILPMPIEFRCTQCGKLLRTGDDTVGRQAQCPECGSLTKVPGPGETTGAPPQPAALGAEGSASPGVMPGCPFGPGAESGGAQGSENPYQSPGAYAYVRGQPIRAAQRVSAPATALIVTAVLGIIAQVARYPRQRGNDDRRRQCRGPQPRGVPDHVRRRRYRWSWEFSVWRWRFSFSSARRR